MAARKIAATSALVTDSAALRRMLVDVPDADQIQTELHKPYFTRRWQPALENSFWITSDGIKAVCLTLTGLDLDETIAIWVCFDEHRQRARSILSARRLSEVIETGIGLKVEITD